MLTNRNAVHDPSISSCGGFDSGERGKSKMEPDRHARFIRKLMRKQDSVIEQLDELNLRIEAAIKAAAPPQSTPELVAPPIAQQQAA